VLQQQQQWQPQQQQQQWQPQQHEDLAPRRSISDRQSLLSQQCSLALPILMIIDGFELKWSNWVNIAHLE